MTTAASKRPLKQKKQPAHPGLTEYVLIVSLIALAFIGIITIFGDNIRRQFGMSADALAGDANIAARNTSGAGNATNLTAKTMRNFGANNTYGGGTGPVVAPALGDTHVAYAPNPTVEAARDNLSTFAIDVDTASYTFGRQSLRARMLPRPESVRVEEWVNAFRYDLKAPKGALFAVHSAVAKSPFDSEKVLLKVSLQGKRLTHAERMPANLVFLVDTSGSMTGPDRLELAKESMRILVGSLDARDTVAIVTYAGGVRDVLAPTPGDDRGPILAAINGLYNGGGTAMGSGMELAYGHAVKRVRSGTISRVLVFTDGDANIGRTGMDILSAVKNKVQEGVLLTTVGFGMGNYRDATLEQLADRGNGQSVYVDTRDEAVRLFGKEGAPGTLQTIAKDVKVQVEFDPRLVKSYRLVGYENRDVADADFKNDLVDGGELGAGHSVTALYELTLTGKGKVATVKVHGQKLFGAGAFDVETKVSLEGEVPELSDSEVEMRFASAVALSADLMRGANPSGERLGVLVRLAGGATANLAERSEFVSLMQGALQARFPSVAVR